MSNAAVNREATLLAPTALINLYILDLNPIGVNEIIYAHDGASSSRNFAAIVFAGQSYMAFPVLLESMAYTGDGSVPRPKLHLSNINGFISQFLLQNQDIIGAKITRRRVFARFLDAVNFPGGVSPYTPDPTAAYPDEIFFLNRKITENRMTVSFELATAFELDGVKLPNRPLLALICPIRYRDPTTCGYSGPPISDSANNTFHGFYGITGFNNKGTYATGVQYYAGDYVTTSSPLSQMVGIPFVYVANQAGISTPLNGPGTQKTMFYADSCSHSVAGCKLHYPSPLPLKHGGFPGLSRAQFIASF